VVKESCAIVLILVLVGCASKPKVSTREYETNLRVENLQKRVKEQEIKLNNLVETVENINRQLNLLVQENIQANPAALEERFADTEVPQQPAPAADADIVETTPAAAEPPASAEEGSMLNQYKQALELYWQNDFKQAIRAFREFLKAYPQGYLSDNALYWLGECLYSLGRYTDALVEFQNVRRIYASGNKVPAAYLKEGYCYMNTGERKEARRILRELMSRFPRSSEALKAQELLENKLK